MLASSLNKLITSQCQQALYLLTALNLLFTEIEESSMNTHRSYDPVEVDRLVDLYYIIEMQFVVEKLMYQFHEDRFSINSGFAAAV